MQPAEWLGNRIVGRPGAFIRSGVPGIARYAPQSAETDEGALTVNRALEQAGRTNPDKRPTIGVAKSGETFRVRLSGRPKTVADAYKQIQGKLPKNYVLETTEPDVPIRPARNPDGSVFPSGEHCVERGLYAGSRANNAPIEFMSVYESSKGQFIKPCASCVLNEPNIVTGVPSGGLPQVTIPPQGQKADNE